MTDLDHRVGVRENNLVVRNLKLSKVTNVNIKDLIEEIDQLFGSDEVSYNKAEQTIHLAYDAANVNLHKADLIYRLKSSNLKLT